MNEEVIFGTLVVAGMAMIVGLAISDRLYDFNLRLYRKWGWTDFADRWNARKSWWLPACKTICLVLGVTFILIAFWILAHTTV